MKPWKKNFYGKRKNGLHLRVENNVDSEVRRACLEFVKWLRAEYDFPTRVTVYVKAACYVRAENGEQVYGTCWRPFQKSSMPYIRVSTGDYHDLLESIGQDRALATILCCIAMMLTHYFQWLNDLNSLTEEEEIHQAERCAKKIILDYSKTREHP